jgi:Mn-containing catalase
MLVRNKRLQYPVRVDKPDPIFAKQVQELLGGKYGEFTVMSQYFAQGWSLRGAEGNPRLTRIKDLLLDTATEEVMHVEMLATMIGMLLDGASPQEQAAGAAASASVAAAMGGMNPQHVIVGGLSAQYADSAGNPWSGAYVTASGNPAADMYANLNAEVHGRLQAARVRELTDDPGIRDTISFMLARDHLHQMQWLAAIEELGGVGSLLPIPQQAQSEPDHEKYAYAVMAYSQDPADTTTGTGPWATGPATDGRGQFTYVAEPFAVGREANLAPAPATVYDSLPGDPVGKAHQPKQVTGEGGGMIETIKETITGR